MGTNSDRVRAGRAFSEGEEAVEQVGVRVDESAEEPLSASRTELDDSGFVDFAAAGTQIAGDFRCADCGYGAVVQSALPPCPMCGGTVWESRGPLPRRLVD
jgi:rubrerythrin